MNNLNFNNQFPLFLIPQQLLAAIQQQQLQQQLQAQVEESLSARTSETNSSNELPTSRSSQSASTSGSQSVPLQSGCNFCNAPTGQQGRGLIPCACETVHYCTNEHKAYDWKRHKLVCSTNQLINSEMTKLAAIARLSGSLQNLSHSIPTHSNADTVDPLRESKSAHDNIMDDDDEDEIQIIDPPEKTNTPDSARLSRKRPLHNNLRTYKDHSKNVLFKATLQEHLKHLASCGIALNQHQAIALRLRYIAEHVIRSLNEFGWAVVDNFLGKTHCQYVHREVERLYERGLFSAGQLVDSKKEEPKAQEIRSDQIYWFDSSDERARDSVTVRLLVSMIDSVIVHFKDRIPPYNISGRSRAMVAVYPGNGTKYVKHVDNPVRDGRCITSIYYCNEDWNLENHGGTLRLYPESSMIPMDIDPQGDRLIFFWSDRRNPHEVLPVYRHRYAITIWYFDHDEKNEALARRKQAEAGTKVPVDVQVPKAASVEDIHKLPNSDTNSLIGINRPSAFKPFLSSSSFQNSLVSLQEPGASTATQNTSGFVSTTSDSYMEQRRKSYTISARGSVRGGSEKNSDSLSTSSINDQTDDLNSTPPDVRKPPDYVI